MKLFLRKLHGRLLNWAHPGYGKCSRCGRVWAICEPHITPYDGYGVRFKEYGGCFALCQECWEELTPQERLPHYLSLLYRWMSYGSKAHRGMPWDVAQKKIEESVLSGK